MLFETIRLRVRQLDTDDAAEMAAVYGDRDAMKYVDDGDILTFEECEAWIAKTRQNYATYGYGMSAIELRETGEVVGFIGGVHPNGQLACEIKYAFKRALWGGGYATEAARGMVSYLGETHVIDEVIASIDPANGASRRVLEKSGFTFSHNQLNDDGSVTEYLAFNRSHPA